MKKVKGDGERVVDKNHDEMRCRKNMAGKTHMIRSGPLTMVLLPGTHSVHVPVFKMKLNFPR